MSLRISLGIPGPLSESAMMKCSGSNDVVSSRLRFCVLTSASLALLIGSLGLYSLVSFVVQQKTKELGIRKVIGANSLSLVCLLSGKYVLFILLATLLAAPLGYLGANLWLESFAYRTSIGFSVFLIAFVVTTLIAMASIGYRAFKAVTMNPIITTIRVKSVQKPSKRCTQTVHFYLRFFSTIHLIFCFSITYK